MNAEELLQDIENEKQYVEQDKTENKNTNNKKDGSDCQPSLLVVVVSNI